MLYRHMDDGSMKQLLAAVSPEGSQGSDAEMRFSSRSGRGASASWSQPQGPEAGCEGLRHKRGGDVGCCRVSSCDLTVIFSDCDAFATSLVQGAGNSAPPAWSSGDLRRPSFDVIVALAARNIGRSQSSCMSTCRPCRGGGNTEGCIDVDQAGWQILHLGEALPFFCLRSGTCVTIFLGTTL